MPVRQRDRQEGHPLLGRSREAPPKPLFPEGSRLGEGSGQGSRDWTRARCPGHRLEGGTPGQVGARTRGEKYVLTFCPAPPPRPVSACLALVLAVTLGPLPQLHPGQKHPAHPVPFSTIRYLRLTELLLLTSPALPHLRPAPPLPEPWFPHH